MININYRIPVYKLFYMLESMQFQIHIYTLAYLSHLHLLLLQRREGLRWRLTPRLLNTAKIGLKICIYGRVGLTLQEGASGMDICFEPPKGYERHPHRVLGKVNFFGSNGSLKGA